MKLVVVDIDGTVSDWRWREQFMDDKEKFYELSPHDPPHEDMCELVKTLANSRKYKIVFLTGRGQRHAKMTSEWLADHVTYPLYEDVIMRPDGDERPDHEVKVEAFMSKYKLGDIAFVLEDRTSVVEAWRKLGVRVLQVSNYEK